MRKILLVGLLVAAGCAPTQQYWVRPATSFEQANRDVAACRVLAQGQIAYSGQQIEQPCMFGKGYKLSTTVPAPP